jgi:hypothetical protein
MEQLLDLLPDGALDDGFVLSGMDLLLVPDLSQIDDITEQVMLLLHFGVTCKCGSTYEASNRSALK